MHILAERGQLCRRCKPSVTEWDDILTSQCVQSRADTQGSTFDVSLSFLRICDLHEWLQEDAALWQNEPDPELRQWDRECLWPNVNMCVGCVCKMHAHTPKQHFLKTGTFLSGHPHDSKKQYSNLLWASAYLVCGEIVSTEKASPSVWHWDRNPESFKYISFREENPFYNALFSCPYASPTLIPYH